MSKHNTNRSKWLKRLSVRCATVVLTTVMLMQTLSLGCFALADNLAGLFGKQSGNDLGFNGIGSFNSDETIAQMKAELNKYMNQDLLMKVEDYRLSGTVKVILTFKGDSMISSYTAGKGSSTYEEFRNTAAAQKLQVSLQESQNKILASLQDKGLISEVKYNYVHALNGAYVTTTYEQLKDICNVEGIERVTVSDTYLPAIAVENPVNVYGTGIFNSGDVSYTGRGTIVAVLDTGCDYAHSAFTTHQVQDPLYNRDDIAGFLPQTQAYSFSGHLEAREVYYGNITGNKIAFGYDYADRDPDIMPFSNEHGTHVAGIIAGKDDTITGVAVDAQLAIMKVFSDYKVGAEDGDILAALEDCVILGVDAINMSLGTSCGFSREADDDYKNSLYDSIKDAGISLIVAASNDYSSGYGSEEGNTNKTDNPDSATVGAPSTYDAALSVASISGRKDRYMLANGEREVFFHESYNMAAKEYDFFAMLGVTPGSPKEYEYVTIPGIGLPINYAGLDMTNKIALVSRGENTFEEKVQYAAEAGAVAIIIYNNIPGVIIMTVGNDAKIPVISIDKDDGEALAAVESGVLSFNFENQAGPFMSDFSSWGPTPSLQLKPEITAHGGNILSAIPGGGYEELSGTSMAAPNMCGIVVLIRQYVKEKYPELSATEVRDMVNQLCMSTATIALDNKGNPYSPRKQGAGIADLKKSTTTNAYLFVEGSGKTKLELGDDPARTGVYTMSIQLKNLSDKTVSYRMGNITMTETVSSADPEYVAERGYLLSNTASYSVKAGTGTMEGDVVSVPAGGCATVTATIVLSAADKAYINSSFKNGMFVEGFLTFDNQEANGVDLNAPFLAFYGDWSEAPIFDLDYYEEETEAHNNAIDEEDKIKADYYPTTPLGSYYYDYIIPLGTYVYSMDEEEYTPIPATREKAAVSYYKDCISGIYGVFCGLLRGAKEMVITITDTATGEVVWTDTQYDCYKAHFGGAQIPYFSEFDLPMIDIKNDEVFGYNNAKYEVTMSATLDWEGNRNSSDTYSFSFTIDYEPPTVTDAEFRTEYDKSREENRYYVDVYVYDNQYAMTLFPAIVYETEDDDGDGEPEKVFSSLSDYPIPVYQENAGEITKVTVEITDYMDRIKGSDMPEGISFYVTDYALNGNIFYVPFPETENAELEFITSTMDMDINQTFDLTTYLAASDNREIEPVYLEMLTWSSSDESVVAVRDGKIEALKAGTATVKVTGASWGEDENPLYKSIVITVSETVMDNPNSAANVPIEDLSFTGFTTLFAFNGDIDYSAIGKTDSVHYFGGKNSIEFYPSEKIQLHYNLKPWNIDPDRYTLKWTSSNPKVVTVDEEGVVTAHAEGSARVTLQITIDGKTSLLAARCSFEVKSEFVIENRTLVAYKGHGGEVVIPDDEGILYIGAFAFCHFDLDNEKEVEVDEDGDYDFDDKKDPLGNTTVTSVVIPDGVETISKYAFYNCSVLRDVTLPESCETIEQYAFYNCDVLETINLDHVRVISDYAFNKCESLTCDLLGGINLSGVNSIGKYAFAETRISTAILSNLCLSGEGAFKDCSKLETVELGLRTRLAPRMFENTPVESIVIYSDTVPDYAFVNCQKLTSVELRGDLTYLGKEAFSECTALESVIFAGICEEIAEYAFSNCTSLESITLPDCEIVIGDGAFVKTGLTELKFSKNTFLEKMGAVVFSGVDGMQANATNSDHYKVENGILYSKDGSKLIMVMPDARTGNFTVPANVKEIGAGAFSSNNYLTAVSFAEGSVLETIGYGAFADCMQLKTVILPDREITIGDSVFYGAGTLREINLNKVTAIGDMAFAGTALTEVNLPMENVTIGQGAFYGCNALRVVTLAAGAHIGPNAFAEAPIVIVTLNGEGVVVDKEAFFACTQLTTFDFTKLTGTVGNHAFYYCVSLKTVDMPNVTEIGDGAFAGCISLTTFHAEKLEIIGDTAFAPVLDGEEGRLPLTSVKIPKAKEIGGSAFYFTMLEEIELPSVTFMGEGAFGFCSELTKVTLPETLTELPDYAFYECVALKEINLNYVVRIGALAFAAVSLPARLELPNVEYIGMQAFVEIEDQNTLEFVNAPKLKQIGSQAFVGCKKLKGINAPVLEKIELGAFAYTAIEEIQISDFMTAVEYAAFEGCESFKNFYAVVDGEKVYNYEGDSVMLKDGVLYSVVKNGYVLMSYPAAKEDKVFTVADNTVRIEFAAVMGSLNLEEVIFPESLRRIGDFAFFDCENLKKLTFNSYYAPVIEGSMSGEQIEITPETVEQYPGFDKLYKYDYYYIRENEIALPFYYHNFIGVVASEAAQGMTYVIPDGCSGYDTPLYRAYFEPSDTNSGVTVGRFAVAFIDAVRKLPEVVDRFDKSLVDAAINAYNALEGHTDEMEFVDASLVERYKKACVEYNVSVAENKINHLFDMACDEYSYEAVKDARAFWLSLTDAEQALVSNKDRLEAKTAELATVMGKELDFNLSFKDYFQQESQDPVDPQPPVDPEPKPGLQTWQLIVIIAASVVVIAAAAVTVIIIVKKRNVK